MNAESEKNLKPVDAGSQALADALRSSFAIVKFVMVVLVAVFMFSGCFTVGPQEKAIVLRFGKPVGEGENQLLGSGWHWGLPYPIDEVVKIPITEVQQVKSSVGWFFQTPAMEAAGEEPPAGASLNPAVDGYALTADGNIVHVKATLSYRIEDPVRCVFGFASDAPREQPLAGVSVAVQNALNNALLSTAAAYKVDDILTRDKIGFQDSVRRRVVQLVEEQNLGVVVENCPVESRPPRQPMLKMAFDNVVAAGQNRAKMLDDARTFANQTLNRASADATAVTNLAVVERARLIAEAAADAQQFEALLARYQENQNLFKRQRLIETTGRVLTNVQDKAFLPTSADGKPMELRLLLNRENPKPKPATTNP
jgi:membrane protease subunit HflK